MSNALREAHPKITETPSTDAGPCEAVVSAVIDARTARVETRSGSVEAKVAMVGDYRPAMGDRVVLLTGTEHAWIVGVLGSLRPVTSEPALMSLRAADGVAAELDATGHTLVVRDPRGQLLFTHDAETGRSTVVSRELHVCAEHGDLTLESTRAVRIQGRQVEIAAGEHESLSMSTTGTTLSSRVFGAALDEGRLVVKNAFFAAERVESAAKRTRHFVDVAELHVGRLVERAKDTFREVEGVSQTRAGRIRTVAKGAYHLLAERATIKAEDDLALMGEKISLA